MTHLEVGAIQSGRCDAKHTRLREHGVPIQCDQMYLIENAKVATRFRFAEDTHPGGKLDI